MREKDIKIIKNMFKGLKKYRVRNKNTNYYIDGFDIEFFNWEVNNSLRDKSYSYSVDRIKDEDSLLFLLYDQLNKDDKQLIDMKYRDGLTVKEISSLLYISESTYFRRIKRIFEKLLNYYYNFRQLFE